MNTDSASRVTRDRYSKRRGRCIVCNVLQHTLHQGLEIYSTGREYDSTAQQIRGEKDDTRSLREASSGVVDGVAGSVDNVDI